MESNVLIIGGKGFIGFHIVQELQQRNYAVTIGSRTNFKIVSNKIPTVKIDLQKMSDLEIEKIISDFDMIVFAGGADDRKFPNEPAKTFFYNGNVLPCVRLASISKNLKVQKIIILGSYFTHFHRLHPEWKMDIHHPYVKSRILQYEDSVKASKDKTNIIVLEIPYVFGATPNKIPLWKTLINYIKKWPIVFYTKGGTNIISVEQVAKATVGAIKNISSHQQLIIGNQNVSWKELIDMISKALHKKRIVITIPTPIVKFFAFIAKINFRVRNKQSGLDMYHFITTQTSNTFLDTKNSMELLSYEKSEMQQSINETIKACNY